MSRLTTLAALGQSVWLDNLSRELLDSGALTRLITKDSLGGITSNPAIFEKSIGSGRDYDATIKPLVLAGADLGTILDTLCFADICQAADALTPVYAASSGMDGYVSLEVSPYIARDLDATIAEALRLWDAVARPNLMIKIPATREGVAAVRILTGRGINVNATLLFATETYREVAEAYIAGLEALPQGHDLSRVASVASFFISRIDAKIDAAIDSRLAEATKEERGKLAGLSMLRGKIAVANAKMAYRAFQQITASPRWAALAARGARPQRLLWASTGTKNKAYSDVLYVDALIGAETVNTMPPDTLAAFREHGTPKLTIESGYDEALEHLHRLEEDGLSLAKCTSELLDDGVEKFAAAADSLFAALAAKRARILEGSQLRVKETLHGALPEVEKAIANWAHYGNVRRLWQRDAALWTNGSEARWLGWLDIAARERADLAELNAFRREAESGKLSDAVLIGMGGSSLGAAVLAESFGHRPGWPRLWVLDSTDPDQIREVEKHIDYQNTRFIVASKSGSTLEPTLLKDYFWARARECLGSEAAGEAFIAITDPGSELEAQAKAEGFARTFLGDPQIGGRFSVLSKFGLVPGAAIGLDLERFLDETGRMVAACGPLVPPAANPGVRLGLILGTLASRFGRDKVTILSSEGLHTMGAWLEQLIAESTGKQGLALIPLDGEALGDPACYGRDRVFVLCRLAGVDYPAEEIRGLEEAGHPVIQIVADDSYQLGQLFFLWQIAVSVIGAVMGINPFNQPDVEAAKIKTRELTEAFEAKGALPASSPLIEQRGIALFADPDNAKALGTHDDIAGYLKAHLGRLREGDYFALLAFIEQCPEFAEQLSVLRLAVRDHTGAATCAGFGPRYLHSTGQAYKGGPDTGLFIEITAEPAEDLEIPGRRMSFGMVERAQALGDYAVLAERGRRVIRLHLRDVAAGLTRLGELFACALA